MKYLKYLLILLFIPFLVLAEECDISKITITAMEQSGIEGKTEVISAPTYQDRNISLNLKMYEVGDSITYNMTIKNDSEEDYMIDEDTFTTDSDYIEYSLKTNDNTNAVKANSTKEVTLVITYKKEVDDSLLTNNKFDASNNLKLSMNTSDKEQELDVITTDNIKESLDPEVNNPITSVTSISLVCFVLLIAILIIYFSIHNKKEYNKFLILILSMTLIPVVYAVCKVDIEVESSIEIVKYSTLHDTVVGLSTGSNACVVKYEGNVTDEIGKTVSATNVYYDKCEDKRNVIFGGFCWQVIRTTETGGTKLLYNGEPVDGKCESTRERHFGVNGDSTSTTDMRREYTFGSSFTIDKERRQFVLKDTFAETWSDTTAESLIGKVTCLSASDTCSTIYIINAYNSSSKAYALNLHIGNTIYNQIGSGLFNLYNQSHTMVGYMFNTIYQPSTLYPRQTYRYSSSFTYNNETGKYTLTGTIKDIEWQRSYTQLTNAHYTCWNDTGECDTISYIYIALPTSARYINITGGKSVNDVLEEMLFADDVNKYDSNAKKILEAWYASFLSSKTDIIEDTVYCNDRSIADLGPWDSEGENFSSELLFNHNNMAGDLACVNKTDQFAVNNNKAKLTYPIGLFSIREYYNLGMTTGENALLSSENGFMTMSPSSYSNYGYTYMSYVNNDGSLNNFIGGIIGIRPAISLKSSLQIVSGTGSETDSWVIKE